MHSGSGVTSDTALAHRLDTRLNPDPSRVIARLFLPGEDFNSGQSRIGSLIARILSVSEAEIEDQLNRVLADFAPRHHELADTLLRHASMVDSELRRNGSISAARKLMLGAAVTAEFAVEAAALCNPSAVLHPDQTGLEPGQIRAAVSVRCIGEGHRSSIGFVEAVVGPGPTWTFATRQLPAVAGFGHPANWRRSSFVATLKDAGPPNSVTLSVLAALPDEFSPMEFEQALLDIPRSLLIRPAGPRAVDAIRSLISTAYQVEFPTEVALSQRVLTPSAAQESNGMEDARFVLFTDDDGTTEYRATYTAYDGHRIAPRMLTSPDLRTFRAQSLAGPAARNKGMALFPRLVNGLHWSLCRSDGESTGVSSSRDGIVWAAPRTIQAPTAGWSLIQVGNCGSPLETAEGWLVLTHGVGPMRVYGISALLLSLDDPTRVIKRLDSPLLQPADDDRDGYVPNVVYSCGGLIHDGILWLPHGIGDRKIGLAWVDVAELLARMTPTSAD